MPIKHNFTSAVPDSGTPGLIKPSHWNSNHTIDFTTETLSVSGLITKDPYVDVRAFLPNGYVKDGSVDYTTEIQNAINYCGSGHLSGGTVLFPPKHTFKCNIVMKNWVTIKGSWNSTTLIPATSASAVITGDPNFHMVRWGIEGFKINCLAGSTTAIELIPPSTGTAEWDGFWYDNFTIKNIRIEQPKYGIYIKGRSPFPADAQFIQQGIFEMIDITTHNNTINGIYIEGVLLETEFRNLSVRGKGSAAMVHIRESKELNSNGSYWRPGRISFNNCFFDSDSTAGTCVLLENVRAIKFDTCYFEMSDNGIIMRGDKHRSIVENTINDNENIVVTNCQFTDQSNSPILPYIVDGLTIEGNTFSHIVSGGVTNAIKFNFANPRTDVKNVHIGTSNKFATGFITPVTYASYSALPSGGNPNVAGYRSFKTNNSIPTTITAITSGGIVGDEYLLIFNDNNTTVENNSTIKLNGGINFIGRTNDTLKLVYDGTNWYEVSRNTSVMDPYIDVRAFLPTGYVKDGSVDYTTEINSAINYANGLGGAIVLFPPDHTFKCNIVMKSYVVLKGSWSSTVLTPATTAAVIKGDSSNGLDGAMVRWGIEGFIINGNAGQSNGIELVPGNLSWYDTFFIKNVRIEDPKYGIYIRGRSPFAKNILDASITAGFSTLTTTTSGKFTASDVGKYCQVNGAGSAGANLFTTITGFTDQYTITLATSATTTVSNTTFIWGDAQFLQSGRFELIDIKSHTSTIASLYIEGQLIESSFSNFSVRKNDTGSSKMIHIRESATPNSTATSAYSKPERIVFHSGFFAGQAVGGTSVLLENVEGIKFDTCYFEQSANAIIVRGDKHRLTGIENTINYNAGINIHNCVFRDQGGTPIIAYIVDGLTIDGCVFDRWDGNSSVTAIDCNHTTYGVRADLQNINIGNGNKFASGYTLPFLYNTGAGYNINTLTSSPSSSSVAGALEFVVTAPTSAAVTITNINGGISGKIYTLIFNDNLTSIQHNTNIKLAGERDFHARGNDIIRLMYDSVQWREVSRVNTIHPSLSSSIATSGLYTASPGVSPTTLKFSQALVGDVTIKLSGFESSTGNKFRILRQSVATGSFNINVGDPTIIKVLSAAGQWCDVECDNTGSWTLTAYGTL